MVQSVRRFPVRWLGLTISLHVLFHLPFIHLPPCSIHVWRQCNTLAVARNFFEEDNDILRPRVDKRLDTEGVTGMQFPAYEWGLAQIYRITGEHYWVHRVWSLLISSLTLVFIFSFFRKYADDALAGLIAAWVMCWSPEWFYHSINALPDILAMMFGAGALVAFLSWQSRRTSTLLFVTFLMITLSGLIKIQYGLFGLIIVMLLLQDFFNEKVSRQILVAWSSAGLLSAAIVLSWYQYANGLIEKSGLYDFVLQLRPVTGGFSEAIRVVRKNLISDLPELLLNYAGFVLLLLGVVAWFRSNEKRSWIAFPSFILFIIWYVLMLEQMKVHQYYMLPLIFLCIFPVLHAARWLLKNGRQGILYGLLLLMPILAAIRILPARWLKADLGIPAAFADEQQLQSLIQAVPATDRVITVPDKSGCIWLYFLHKKGFAYEDATMFETAATGNSKLMQFKIRGARWVYMPERFLPAGHPVLQSGLELDTIIGGISIYSIR
jgi:hypothetical protein